MPQDNQTQEAQSLAPATAPALRDKRALPEGVVPKQAQGYVIAGLAVLILIAVMFSKTHAKPAAKTPETAPPAMSTDMNQRKIQELQQDLSADQRQSEQQVATQRPGAAVPGMSTAAVANPSQPDVPVAAAQLPPAIAAQAVEPSRDPIADAEKALAFKGRFASNLVSENLVSTNLVSANQVSADDGAPRPADVAGNMPSRSASLQQASASQRAIPTSTTATGSKHAPEVSVNSAHGQPYVIFEGTTIDAVLVNRLDGEFAGPVKVMVTDPVYSQDRQHLLIPEGSFILGEVQKVAGLGQKRLAVAFHRLLMPDGYSVDLDQFHGLDQAGATGLKDKVDNHYAQIFGASIALGVIAGAAEATNANQGYTESGSEAYKSGIASSLSQSSANALDRFINIPPTLTIREGHRIKIYITQDMLLPAYENHSVPGDI